MFSSENLSKWIQFGINLAFAIVGLALVMGVVGLSIYLSHWYSLVNQEPFIYVFGSSWKNVGVSAATFVTLGVVSVVLSFSFPWTNYILSFAGLMQLPSIILVGVIISYTMKENQMTEQFYDKFHSIPNIEQYQKEWGCQGVYKYDSPNCTITEEDKKPMCCDPKIASMVENRTTNCFNWFLGYTLTWLISMVIMIAMSFFFCRSENSN